MNDPIRVFIVDDHDLVREGLTAILSRTRSMHVVGEANSAEAALLQLPQLDPDVIVLDHRLPGMSGLDLCRELAERRIRAQVVVLSGFLDEYVVQAAFRSGARAYVVKDLDSTELERAIRTAARGQTMIDEKVAHGRFASWSRTHPAVVCTPRQLALLRWLAEGKSVIEIQNVSGLTYETVRSYLRDLYRRLDVNSRAEAVSFALRRGLA